MINNSFTWLSAKNSLIVDETGKEFEPLGFGVGGALFPEGYMWQVFGGKTNREKFCESPTYMYRALEGLVGKEETKAFWSAYLTNWLTFNDLKKMKSWGANHIRLPMTWKTLTNQKGSYLEPGFADVRRIVDWCKEIGLYIVLDLHAVPGGVNMWHWSDSDGTARLWEEPEKYWDWTIDLWKEIAQRFREEPCVMGYDLMNEPVLPEGHDISELWELSSRITQAIRTVDQKHIIFVEGNRCATDFTKAERFDDNMAFSFHFYKYDGPVPLQEELEKYLKLREKTGCPLWNGETGDNNADWWYTDIRLHQKNHIGICMWTHKKIVRGHQPYVAKLDPVFQQLALYISERGPKPFSKELDKALMRQADNMKTENCAFLSEYLRGFEKD